MSRLTSVDVTLEMFDVTHEMPDVTRTWYGHAVSRSLAMAVLPMLIAAAAAAREPVTLGSSGPELTYVVLGDSTAAGVGGSYDDGIALATTRHLALSRRVTMTNLAISGARLKDVVDIQLAPAVALRPALVLLSAGANDVTHLTPVGSMRASLRRIVRDLRVANPAVVIVVTGSPDMGAPPRIPRLLRGIASCRTKRVNRMFVEEARALHLTFAPIAAETGPQFRRDHSLFAADRFHPNERGYATWIPVLIRAVNTTPPDPVVEGT